MPAVRRRPRRAERVARSPLPTWDQYAVRWTALHGGIDPRRARPSVERWLRLGYRIAKGCARIRVKPGLVTALGLLACIAVPIVAGRGPWWALLAAGLVVVASVTDTVDGALAVMTSRATRLGYVYDSVVDRLGEACWLLGMWRLGVRPSILVAAGALSWLHEYTRARANSAGMAEIGAATLGERPTRVILAVVGFGLAGLLGFGSTDLPAGAATFAVAVWIVLAVIGFTQLFASIHHSLAGRSWPRWRPTLAQPTPAAPAFPISDEAGRHAARPATTAVYRSAYQSLEESEG